MVLRLDKPLKSAESIMSPHTRLLRPSNNFRPTLQCILRSSCVINNDREDPFPLPQIFMPKEVYLRQLATQTYQSTPSWTPSSCTPEESDYSQHALSRCTRSAWWIQGQQRFSWRLERFTLPRTHWKHHRLVFSTAATLLCHRRKYTLALELRWSITLMSNWNMTLTVALRRTYKKIPTTRLWRVKSTNISSVEWRRKAGRRAMTTGWRKKTPRCISHTSKMGKASRSS